ncbi:MAG: tRNA uridine-5-carboxymethylaminomethyl(34) synthesis GTPase MnmE [Candidatus Margulisbacteria bacterium]|nr:tRNA uridine-5-carboxymethylaminomethyl(34) synthesis GTPase MnmE [Candidatus Margulisiibacteriota bacterium]
MTLAPFADTIAAISTPLGIGGIAVIRISGPDTVKIVKQVSSLNKPVPNQIRFTSFFSPDKNKIDEGLLSFFKGPFSFTGEDMAELNCHGGYVVAQKLIDTLLRLGARQADKGEFTMRAFINGKIDLMQAESVIDLIEAKTEKASGIFVHQLEGRLSKKIQTIREQLLKLISHLEVHLDYPEEEDLKKPSDYANIIKDLVSRIDHLLATYNTGRLLKEGILTVIAGAPNVGKSSLLNALLKDNRAIVTDIPGTTRDTIEEWMQLEGIPFKFVDTAGLRNSQNKIEIIGMGKTKKLINKADLVLLMLDAGRDLNKDDQAILKKLDPKKTVVIINKIDLPKNCSKKITELPSLKFFSSNIYQLSVKKRKGLTALEKGLVKFAQKNFLTASEQKDAIISNDRQKEQLISAKKTLSSALKSIKKGLSEDLWLIDLRLALSTLGSIIGEDISEEVLNDIFSRFCVGK